MIANNVLCMNKEKLAKVEFFWKKSFVYDYRIIE